MLPKLLAGAVVVVVLIGSSFAIRGWLQADSLDSFEDLAAFVIEQSDPADRIAFLRTYDRLGVLYNSRDVAPDSLPTMVVAEEPQTPAWRGPIEIVDLVDAAENGRLWVVVRTEDGEIIPEHRGELERLGDAGFDVASVTEFPQRAVVEIDGSDR